MSDFNAWKSNYEHWRRVNETLGAGGVNPTVAKCKACGLALKAVMGFVCPHTSCPIQPKLTCEGDK